MRMKYAFCFLTAIAVLNAPAQDDEATRAKIARGQAIISEMEQYVDHQEKVVEDMTSSLLAMDASVETRIDQLVTTLASLKDSQDSGADVERLKKDLIDGLQRSIQFYQQRRAAKKDDLIRGTSTMSDDDLEKDMKHLDDRTDTRIAQIVELTQSFAQQEYVDKYIYTVEDGRWRKDDEVRREINPAYRQNKKVTDVSEQVRAGLIEDARSAIAKLKNETIIMQQNLRAATSQEQHDLIASEIDRNHQQMDVLSGRIQELTTTGSPETTIVGGEKAAQTLAAQVRETLVGIQQDYRTMLARKSQLDLERSRLHTARIKLEYNQRLMNELTKGDGRTP